MTVIPEAICFVEGIYWTTFFNVPKPVIEQGWFHVSLFTKKPGFRWTLAVAGNLHFCVKFLSTPAAPNIFESYNPLGKMLLYPENKNV